APDAGPGHEWCACLDSTNHCDARPRGTLLLMDHPTRPIASLQALPPCEPLTGVLSLPPRLRPGAPLLCFLHGRGEAQPEAAPVALSRHGPLYPLSALDAPFEQDGAAGFVVVAPQLPVAGDHWHEHADRVRRLVEEVEAYHDTDPS